MWENDIRITCITFNQKALKKGTDIYNGNTFFYETMMNLLIIHLLH